MTDSRHTMYSQPSYTLRSLVAGLVSLCVFVKIVSRLGKSIRSVVRIFLQSCLDFFFNLSAVRSVEFTISFGGFGKI